MHYSLPYYGKISGAKYFYFKGGYHSIPDGCTPWGISDSRYNRFIGDQMGKISLTYEDGITDEIPLIFGYTLWFKSVWLERCMPFQGESADPELVSCLKETLFLKGAYEGEDPCILCVRGREKKTLLTAEIKANPEKEGVPVFREFTCSDILPANIFFQDHIADPTDPYPIKIQKNIDRINKALLTFESDYREAPEFQHPKNAGECFIHFTGSNSAKIANGVIFHNLKNLMERVDSEGFLHTSYRNAPSWRYDGFGPWIPAANSYYDKFYSRDAGRALMTINAYGENEKTQRSLQLANRLMLYFPQHDLEIKKKKIPGHYTVVINEPMLYSEVLRYHGWPTKYTEERFGAECNHLGNQETDGHGLMMMANYCAWENTADKEEFFTRNRKSLLEGAEWILWCLRNPELSFSENGLLYAETEGGMNQFTLYCNIPCCLGLYGYSKIAAFHGLKKEAEEWRCTADRLFFTITKEFSNAEKKWKLEQVGFQHDPTAVMLSDLYGYDRRDYPEAWREISEKTYEDDLSRYRRIPVDGKGGIGYNTAMMTQHALLHDNTKDYTKLAEDLCKICYAPRLPEPYLVPEGISYSERLRAIRRQGDLGNLVQQAEVLKVFLLIFGISPYRDGVLKIMPRLPKGWNLELHDFKIQNTEDTIDLFVSYPSNGLQEMNIKFSRQTHRRIFVRFGPYESAEEAVAFLNGNPVAGKIYRSGDAYWMDYDIIK